MSGPVMDAPPGWTKDSNGHWVQISLGPSSSLAAGFSAAAGTVLTLADPQRLTEPSTYAGLAAGAASVANGDVAAVIGALGLGLAGDIPGALQMGVGPILRLAASAAAIVVPEKKVNSDDQIKTAIAGLSHEQLVSLLNQPLITVNTGTGVGAGSGANGQTGSVSNTAG